jgi:probable F420-dependent oxidoreductase
VTVGVKLQAGLAIEENARLAGYAEQRNLDSVWLSEYRAEAVVSMAVLAKSTERVTIGSSILPIYTRSPAVLAATAASLWELAPGRVILGLGTSTDLIVERWHGVERKQPLRALEDYVRAIRAIVGGARAHVEGTVYSVDGFQLQHPRLAAPETPIYVAGLTHKGLELAGRVADGALLNLFPLGHLRFIRGRVDAGSAAAGRGAGAVPLAGDVQVAVATGSAARRMRELLRKQTAFYAAVPQYNRLFAEAGYATEATAVQAAWKRRDRDAAVAAIGDDLLDSIAAVGTEQQVQEHLTAVHAAGLDHVIVYPLFEAGADASATRRTIDIAAEALGTR